MIEQPSPDHYRTVAGESTAETKVKGSRFWAEIRRARTEEEARQQLQSIRRRNHDATHHCSAWRVGPPDSLQERFDDDGEPAGSAGRPILSALTAADLHEVVAVVTRWYGGTKLGTGGLARAYADTTRLALERTRLRTVYREEEITIHTDYDHVGAIEALLGRESSRIRGVERDYGAEARLRIRVLRGDRGELVELVRDCTAANARCEWRDLPRS